MTRSLRLGLGVLAPLVVIMYLAACLPTPAGPTGLLTPSPTACATITPMVFGTAAVPTQSSGQTNPATLMPFPPTLSPESEATQLARMGNANPGAPTTAAAQAQTTPLPPCATATPAQ